MSGARYEQINVSSEPQEFDRIADLHNEEKMTVNKPRGAKPLAKTLALILFYFTLSIGLTFYQRWLLQSIKFPLSIVMFHLVFKWLVSGALRCALHRRVARPILSFGTALRSVAPVGLASGIDVGMSNWGLALVTVSLYTMTKSTVIIFILGFAILFGLEKKSWSLMLIVVMISSGLTLFTYKATQFSLLGFALLLVASLSSGLRWTCAQLLMQKSKLGLSNPLDMVYYVQPWMMLSVLPFTVVIEGAAIYEIMMSLADQHNWQLAGQPLLLLNGGALLAFAMELSEYLVVHHTSSLTLSVAGIFKEMCILILAVEMTGDQLSLINTCGLLLCLCGISGHVYHKSKQTNGDVANVSSIHASDNEDANIIAQRSGNNIKLRGEFNTGSSIPLLGENDSRSDVFDMSETDSDNLEQESSQVLFDVLKRRDHVNINRV